MTTATELHRLRRRVHLTLGAALLASVAANVLAAEPTLTGRAVAAWPPVALMLVVDVLGRAPTANGWTGRAAAGAAGLVASVAALASFAHVRHVALMVGESELVAWVLPLSVDGLAVVCSVALVEINRQLHASPTLDTTLDVAPAVSVAPLEVDRLPAADLIPGAGVPGSVSLFVPPLGAASPVLNGAGSHKPNDQTNGDSNHA